MVAAAKVLNKALSKLPAYKEVTVRNTPLSKDIQMRYQPGKVVMEHGFTGTSKKKPHGVFSGNTRFYVTPKAGGGRGKDISAMFDSTERKKFCTRHTRCFVWIRWKAPLVAAAMLHIVST